MPLETNIDDLTDAGVHEVLDDLGFRQMYWGKGLDFPRLLLSRIVRNLDRASPDWPQSVLGLKPVA